MKAIKILTLLLALVIGACANKKPEPQPSTLLPVQNEVIEENISAKEVAAEVSFANNSVVYFDFDVSTPQASEVEKVLNQASWLNNHPNFQQVIIEGHTDIYGTREYNLALGEKRANSIKEILVKNGVPSGKIKIVSYGKEQLADHNIQAQNRRTLTKVIW